METPATMDQPPLPKPNTSTGSAARSILLVVGLCLMGLGVWLFAIFYLFFIISAALYIIGAVLVLLSGPKPPAWLKVLAIWFPILAWFGTVVASQHFAKKQPAATFLIPDGYEGPVLLVLGEPCGLPPEEVDGRLIYHVPANGIIITQNRAWDANAPENAYPNQGYFSAPDNEYYQVDRAGQRLRELTELSENYDEDPNAAPHATTSWIGVGRDDVGVFPQSPIIFDPTDGDSTRYNFQEFNVSSFARLHRQENNDRSSAQHDLADRLVAQCRQRGGRPPARAPVPVSVDSTTL
jgi:hypothetical protein